MEKQVFLWKNRYLVNRINKKNINSNGKVYG